MPATQRILGLALLATIAAGWHAGDAVDAQDVAPQAGPATPGPSPPPAPEPDARLRQIQERRTALERELSRLRGEERSLLGQVEQLELQERLSAEALREAQLLLQRTNAELDATLGRVRVLEESLRLARPQLRARARALYKLGELSYLRLLLSVDEPADLFRGYRFVTALARRDNQRFASFRADLGVLESTRRQLEERTREALQRRADLERNRRGLESDRRRKTELLTSLVERKETHATFVQELQTAEGHLERLLDGLDAGEVHVPIAAFRGSLPWPVTGSVRVPFGRRKHPRFDTYTLQNGVQIAAALDTPVHAVHEGQVAFAEHFRGYGRMVVVDHGAKYHTLYAHLADVLVKPGERVVAGQTLGTAGNAIDGPGLYFELRVQGRAEDPAEWLRRAER